MIFGALSAPCAKLSDFETRPRAPHNESEKREKKFSLSFIYERFRKENSTSGRQNDRYLYRYINQFGPELTVILDYGHFWSRYVGPISCYQPMCGNFRTLLKVWRHNHNFTTGYHHL